MIISSSSQQQLLRLVMMMVVSCSGLYRDQRVMLSRGVRGYVSCPALAEPPATLIVWTKDGQVLDTEQRGGGRSTDSRGSLVIDTVSLDDEGLYYCSAYSPLNDLRTDYPIWVGVKELPFFTLRPSAVYTVIPGRSVILPCAADGQPRPSIVWRKVFGEFPPSTRTLQDVGNLTIVDVSLQDDGAYECVASNLAASIVTVTVLIVHFHNSPHDVMVRTTSSTAKVTWLPAHNRHHVYHYVLWFRSSQSEIWQTVRVVPSDSYCLTVYGLRSWTRYQFMILARDQSGVAHFSRIVNAMTARLSSSEPSVKVADDQAHQFNFSDDDDDDDDGRVLDDFSGLDDVTSHGHFTTGDERCLVAPENVTSRWLQQGGVNISWMQQRPQQARCQFMVEYRTVGQWVPLTQALSSTWYRWSTASRGAVYHFRVISLDHSNSLRSPPSRPVSIETGDPMRGGGVVSAETVAALIAGVVLVPVAAIALVVVARFLLRRHRDKQQQQLHRPRRQETTNSQQGHQEVGVVRLVSGGNVVQRQQGYNTPLNTPHSSSSVVLPPSSQGVSTSRDHDDVTDCQQPIYSSVREREDPCHDESSLTSTPAAAAELTPLTPACSSLSKYVHETPI